MNSPYISHIILNFQLNYHNLRFIWEEKLREWAVHRSTLITSDSSRSDCETQCGTLTLDSRYWCPKQLDVKRRNRAILCLAFLECQMEVEADSQASADIETTDLTPCLCHSVSLSWFLSLWLIVVYSQSTRASKLNSLAFDPCLVILESRGQGCEMCLCR